MRLVGILIIAGVLFISACHNVGDKTKQALNKTGEAIGEGASEFGKGVKTGVENTFDSEEVVIVDTLKSKGVSFGKYSIASDSASSNKNKLTIYLIFDKDFNGNILTKVFDKYGREYGRASIPIHAKQGEAKYADFVFDPRTDVESKSKITLE
jgi:hypothetical protein